MNWYKRSQIEPWQMTRQEYEASLNRPLKPNDVFYIRQDNKNIEVVQNPTQSDIRSMSEEVKQKFPNMPKGEPTLRFTQDIYGNKYMWKSDESTHADIEPKLSVLVGETLGQVTDLPSHYNIVRRAVFENKPVPQHIQDEYPNLNLPTKQAQGLFDEDERVVQDHSGNYLHIGHDDPWRSDPNERIVLWAFINGRVEKSDILPITSLTDHDSLWDKNTYNYAGRYELDRKRLSVKINPQYELKPIPPSILRSFPQTTEIYKF